MNKLIITDLVSASITFNKDKAIADVKANLTAYYDEEGQFIPLDEDKLAESKKERAKLVKVAKAFNDKAIEVDKGLSVEVKQFRNDVKEVIQVVNDVKDEIDTQIKATEERINVARQNEIMNWQEYIGISDYVAFNNDWLKKSWKDDKKLKVELVNIKSNIDRDISTIKMLASSHDLKSDKYIEMYKEIDLASIQHRIIEDMALISGGIATNKPIVIDNTSPVTTITRNLTGTIQQLKLVKDYCINLGVSWSE